jgi:hypothetical protein
MSTPIFNREFQHPADGWYQIEAKGEHPNDAAGVVQVIDDTAIESIVDSFNADAKAGKLRHGNEMLVDIEHFKDQPDKESRAYGWLQELEARPDGIYGRIHWTSTGQAAVDGGDYRFFSTEYDSSDLKVLSNGNPKRVRPMKLDGLTLTNMNNNRGQKAITNRTASPGTRAPVVDAAAAREAQDKAAWLFNQLVVLEQKLSKIPASAAWDRVMNRECPLFALANGTQPAERVFTAFPELNTRLKIYNRAVITSQNDSANKAANAAAPTVLEYLQRTLAEPDESLGGILAKRGASEGDAWRTLLAQIKKLKDDQGLSVADAFAKLKRDEPLFWTQAVLSFPGDPEE